MGILGSKKFTVTRYTTGTVTDGVESVVVDSTFTIQGSLQPHEVLAGGEANIRLMGGFVDLESSAGMLKIYTATALLTTNEDAGTRADILTYEGEEYEVHNVERHISIIPHYRATLIRRGR